jgi:hypothetical protein
MHRLKRRLRRLVTAPCALLIVIALQHCLWEGAMAARHAQSVAALAATGEPLPIGMPKPGCDNESGCICRGATLVQSTTAVVLPTMPVDLFLSVDESPCSEWGAETTEFGRFHHGLYGLPRVSGRMLRARLSLLVI